MSDREYGVAAGLGAEFEIREFRGTTPTSVPSELRSGVVHIWRLSPNGPSEVGACHEFLSPEERMRAARFLVERPRTEFILTRAMLRFLVASYLRKKPQEVSFSYSEYGKPRLNEAVDLHFNVSHTEGLALAAFARDREIGVDAERIRPLSDARSLANRFFSVHERQLLEKLSGDELYSAFFRCWTRKEAYVKARGEGLSLPLHQFDVSIAEAEGNVLLATRPDPLEAGRWIVRSLPVGDGYVAALAVAATVGGGRQSR